ncbi:sugar isomerase domain-containing protein [Phytoactinopolyspora halotolerans]|uniref:Sugar isomerase domain-containing protein n=1 Tax=Phytoactinopolyspora halotolerans TaxID=1981512 RepID=A0A6L9SH69_9ACTN|nr:sugar isomerase domain-containing protein [Phytoactinopolyspora halotolerans]NEE04705.1 sugar isomerase domain-containing protein [Phytoactinopolyspora halotolerans]
MSQHDAGGAATTALMDDYLSRIVGMLETIRADEASAVHRAAELIADQVARDELVYVYGPGGHSNLAAQEIFFRAGGLVHISAILDEGTLLSSGALRSMAMERTPGYATVVMRDNRIGAGDLLVLVNAYGINAALIDAAHCAKQAGATVIGVSSREHAEATAPDHPARHPSGANLHDLVDVHVDTKVPVGDAILSLDGVAENVAAVSTFVNAYVLNCIVAAATAELARRGQSPPIWRSGNAPGGDSQHATFLDRFQGRVRWL